MFFMNRFFHCACMLSMASLSFGLSTQAIAQPELYFVNEIIDINLTGTGTLPLGANGEPVTTQIILTRATDHNSSRSNKSSSCRTSAQPVDTDDVDPGNLDGQLFDLYTTLDVQFIISLVDIDPNADFNPALGDTPTLRTTAPAILHCETPSTFIFDADEPDFGMLRIKEEGRGRATGRRQHDPITLSSPPGGQGGQIDDVIIPADTLALTYLENTSFLKPLPNGDLEHVYDVTVSFENLSGIPFAFQGVELTGTVVEQGQLLNTIVPSPISASTGLLLLAGLATRRRR